jgi:phosphoribosylformylglycinamidine synthase
MDLALMAMRKLKKEGKLQDQEESDEINACSIIVPVEVDGETEEWLVFFKNETHNHPTEIEPFGGAAAAVVTIFLCGSFPGRVSFKDFVGSAAP